MQLVKHLTTDQSTTTAARGFTWLGKRDNGLYSQPPLTVSLPPSPIRLHLGQSRTRPLSTEAEI
jgi:hypothetical protein